MGKKRIYQVAQEYGTSTKEIMDKLQMLKIEVKSHMSAIDEEVAHEILEIIKKESIAAAYAPTEEELTRRKEEEEAIIEENRLQAIEVDKQKRTILLGDSTTVKELTEKMNVKRTVLISKLMSMGIMNVNQQLDFETAEVIADEYGFIAQKKKVQTDNQEKDSQEEEKNLQSRPPVITVMGHVDHGKTTLIDRIRDTDVVSGEAGGITQHIGAYQAHLSEGRKITILDTPGHEAFSKMRAHGANVTDIIVLVVAADDGVQPQTVEAIEHASSANIPIIVAVNKIDAPGCNIDKVKQELSNHGLIPEDWGGETTFVEISALKNENIDELMEMVALQAELMELKANPTKPGEGIVIESFLDKGKGPVATLLVQNGVLKKGDTIVVGATFGKVRSMINEKGKQISKAKPSTPVEIFGISEVPEVGSEFQVAGSEKEAANLARERQIKQRDDSIHRKTKISLENLFSHISQDNIKDLNLIIKADVKGSVIALSESLEKLSNEEVVVNIIRAAPGGITEADINLAISTSSIIIGFNVRPSTAIEKMAGNEGIDIKYYRVIYEAIDAVEKALKGMLDPVFEEVVLGKAQVRSVFKVPKIGFIAGSYVTEGKVKRAAIARLIRDGIVKYDGNVSSLRRFKDDVAEVDRGYECGIGLHHYNDIEEGDLIEFYESRRVEV